MTSRKRHALGQHFLSDAGVIDKIIGHCLDQIATQQIQSLIEIGPGKGALTSKLLDQIESDLPFTLIEKDFELGAHWKATLTPPRQVHVADFMDLNPEIWLTHSSIGVVSNLPYSAGTAILNQLAQHPLKIRFMILMFQLEVAQRLYASEGDSQRGSLSLWIQNQWDVRPLFRVRPKSFSPPPKVDSEVVLLLPRSQPLIDQSTSSEKNLKLFQELVRISFQQRRKMLRGIYKSSPLWQQALQQSGVDGTLRAQALSIQEWNSLYQAGLAKLN